MLIDILIIIWLHWFADFYLQDGEWALNKSTNNELLGTHVFVYSLPFLYFGWQFALVTFLGHFVTDYVTSRMSKKRWNEGRIHDFWVVIGADQATHATMLALTYWWLIL